MQAQETLRKYFGHEAFRPGQEVMVNALTHHRDALGVMPTGAGKSMCYQVPALMLPGVSIVISPLISLMADQVAALKSAGVPAAYLNSSLTPRQMDLAMQRARQGAYKIIYVAPERLETPSFQAMAQSMPISLLAVDEAHCVSQWGQDFRPVYLRIADFVDSLPTRPVMGAFTATATERVRQDIIRLLRLQNPETVTTGFDRPNLYFEVIRPKNRDAALMDILRRKRGESGIVYCATRKAVEQVCDKLIRAGIDATRYHAGLSDEERKENQEKFQYDTCPVMVATNAFGMGIDKSNVSFVIHYNMPKSLESYYQEAGRAGRDGSCGECILLYASGDVQTARFLIQNGGTSNALDFLPLDRSGNRRFIPVMVYPEQAEVHILEDEAASRAYISQMWAEAMEIYRSGRYKLSFSPAMQRYLKEHQRDFMPEDTKAGMIQAYLDKYTGETVCSKQLYKEALNHTFDEPKQWEIREINEIMNQCITGWNYFSNPRMFAEYGRQKGWEREIPATDTDNPPEKSMDGFVEVTEQMELPF